MPPVHRAHLLHDVEKWLICVSMRSLSAGSNARRARLAMRAMSVDVRDMVLNGLKPKVNRPGWPRLERPVQRQSVIILPLAWVPKGLV